MSDTGTSGPFPPWYTRATVRMLAALARKVGTIEITGPVKRRYNNTLRGLESLPVTITPA